MATRKSRKKQRLRNNEYYDTQAIYDELYSKAKENRRFTNLYDLIVSRENILLAYRNIKKNKGSKTKGVNATTILDIGKDNPGVKFSVLLSLENIRRTTSRTA